MNARQFLIAFLLIGAGVVGYFYGGSDSDNAPSKSPDRPVVSEQKQASETNTSTEPKPSDPSRVSPAEPETERTKPYRSRRARVLEVYDGDSLKVLFTETEETAEVRIKGIDCPETSEEVDKCGPGGLVDLPCGEQIPLGIRAKSYAKTLLEDSTVTLESYNNFDRGNYGRLLAYVRTPDGEDYGLKTIKKGYCNDSGRIYDHPRDEKYKPHRRPLAR